jgi:ubiquinone/menaquinone biosynthesis C-methylase UbiE
MQSIPSSILISSQSSSSSSYDNYSIKYDNINSGITTKILGIDEMRSKVNNYINNNVLEIAIGTGLQSEFYDWNKIKSFNGIDNSIGMLDQAYNKINIINKNKNIPIELKSMDATKLLYESNTFDTVIDTFSMCVFSEPSNVLKELIRVVKDDGNIILLENSVSTNPMIKFIQNIFEPIVTPFSKGCKWNVNVPELAEKQGLKKVDYIDIQSGTIMLGIYNKK